MKAVKVATLLPPRSPFLLIIYAYEGVILLDGLIYERRNPITWYLGGVDDDKFRDTRADEFSGGRRGTNLTPRVRGKVGLFNFARRRQRRRRHVGGAIRAHHRLRVPGHE